MDFIPYKTVLDFFDKISSSGIQYVLIKNVLNELPYKLKDGKDIDIVVHQDNIKSFEKFMLDNNFTRVVHPYGRSNGWVFGYQLPEHQFWKLNDNTFTFYVDVSFKLSCKSLMPNTWIPLDICINEDIWKNKVFDKKNHWWIMDDETILIYLFVRSIFDKRDFKQGYIDEIEQRKQFLESENVKYKLSKIFFKYTDTLIQKVKKSEYSQIIDSYLSFIEY